MLVPAAQEHYAQVCAVEAASYPADEAATPEGIAMRSPPRVPRVLRRCAAAPLLRASWCVPASAR